jgi:hypothetical protein
MAANAISAGLALVTLWPLNRERKKGVIAPGEAWGRRMRCKEHL